MARRQTVMGTLAQQQRAHAQHVAAQERYQRQLAREAERARREQERAARADARERQRLYLAEQQAEAEHRTAEVAATCDALRSLLADTLEVDDWLDLDLLKERLDLPDFDPGALGQPVPMPDPQQYTLPPLSAVQSLRTSAQHRHAEQQAALTQRWHHDVAVAQSHEAERLVRLDDLRTQWDTWFAVRCMQIREQRAAINLMKYRLEEGDPQTVVDYTSAVLQRSTWPDEFPASFDLSFAAAERHMVVDYAGPDFDVVPVERAFRYVKTADEIRPVDMSAAERKSIYREVIAQLVLRVAHEIFASDRPGHVQKVTVNCFVDSIDPATGRQAERCVGNLSCDRRSFEAIDLASVEPAACVRGLKGQLLDRPDTGRVPFSVRAAQTGGAAHNGSGPGSAGEPNLLDMDPIEFEQLVGRLLTSMGWEVRTTQRSGDGGVDLIADDPDPFTGGTVLVQVKRYRNTVSPDVVRDMFGTLHHVGAGRGLVVTTSSFGPSAHEFVENKPLRLIEGDQLVHLLGVHGFTWSHPLVSDAPRPNALDAGDLALLVRVRRICLELDGRRAPRSVVVVVPTAWWQRWRRLAGSGSPPTSWTGLPALASHLAADLTARVTLADPAGTAALLEEITTGAQPFGARIDRTP